jgi:hypothetical protein
MTVLSQAERIAAIKAKRAAAADEAVEVDQPVVAGSFPSRQIRLTKPTPQRVAAAGISVFSFAAMTLAMGPLTAQVNTADEGEVDDATADPTTAQVPSATSGVVVEVIPRYLAMTEDGVPLPEGTLLPDGTLASATEGTEVVPDELTDIAGSELAATPTIAAPVGTTPIAAPVATAAPAAAPATAAPSATAAPTATAAPATAAPATAAPATAAPVTTAAPAATNPPPPPKSEPSG